MKHGIDISKWQGQIDWKQVKASGVEFATLYDLGDWNNSASYVIQNAWIL